MDSPYERPPALLRPANIPECIRPEWRDDPYFWWFCRTIAQVIAPELFRVRKVDDVERGGHDGQR